MKIQLQKLLGVEPLAGEQVDYEPTDKYAFVTQSGRRLWTEEHERTDMPGNGWKATTLEEKPDYDVKVEEAYNGQLHASLLPFEV